MPRINGKNRVYDAQFKEDALMLLARRDGRPRAVAEALGVPINTLQYWYKLDMAKRKKPARSPAIPPSNEIDAASPEEAIALLKAEIVKLRKRNAELEEDRAILKKTAAFFVKESE